LLIVIPRGALDGGRPTPLLVPADWPGKKKIDIDQIIKLE
jgi:hypothetical protein